MTEAEETMRKIEKTMRNKNKNYFPIKVRIDEGKDQGKVMVIKCPENIPLYVGFTVLETVVNEVGYERQ